MEIHRRSILEGVGLLIATGGSAPLPARSRGGSVEGEGARREDEIVTDARGAGAGDFDFIHGSWRVRHRKLLKRLVGSEDWVEFGGEMHAEPILGGLGNFDQNIIDQPGGRYEACTLRIFNPKGREWSLHWIDGRDPRLDPPLRGRFADGRGTFEGADRYDGRPILVRFTWSRPAPATARWDQAFSADGGRTWEINWIMDFTRP